MTAAEIAKLPPRTSGGFVDEAKLPRGPNGRALCRKCQQEVPRARMTFCSAACVHEWKLRTQPSYQARHVLERDKGVCADCGIDCVGLLAELRELLRSVRRERHSAAKAALMDHVAPMRSELFDGAFAYRVMDLRLPDHLARLNRRLWEMDHIVPVAEGGGSCGLENLRTLCWACHRKATAALRKRLAAKKTSPRLGAD